MRRYESVWVVNGDLPDEEVKSAIDKFSRIISSQGGTLVGLDEWGRRKLAYKIQGTTRGYYVLADFAGSSETVKELERNYRIDDRIIRYLTTKKADQVNLEALQAEIEAKAKAAAPPAEPEAAPEAEAAAPVEAPAPVEPVAPVEAAAPAEAVAQVEAAAPPEAAPSGEAPAPEEAAAPVEAAAPAEAAAPVEAPAPEEPAAEAKEE